MGYARPGCRITAGSIRFDSVNLADVSEAERRKICGARIAYVAQSAAASFNPAHRIIDQYVEAPLQHGVMGKAEAKRTAVDLFRRLRLPDAEHIGFRYPHQVSGGQLQRAMTATFTATARLSRNTRVESSTAMIRTRFTTEVPTIDSSTSAKIS